MYERQVLAQTKGGKKKKGVDVDDELQENMMDLLVDTPITEPDVEGKKSDIIAGKSLSSFPPCLLFTFHCLRHDQDDPRTLCANG